MFERLGGDITDPNRLGFVPGLAHLGEGGRVATKDELVCAESGRVCPGPLATASLVSSASPATTMVTSDVSSFPYSFSILARTGFVGTNGSEIDDEFSWGSSWHLYPQY